MYCGLPPVLGTPLERGKEDTPKPRHLSAFAELSSPVGSGVRYRVFGHQAAPIVTEGGRSKPSHVSYASLPRCSGQMIGELNSRNAPIDRVAVEDEVGGAGSKVRYRVMGARATDEASQGMMTNLGPTVNTFRLTVVYFGAPMSRHPRQGCMNLNWRNK